jgi:hypothetical protein
LPQTAPAPLRRASRRREVKGDVHAFLTDDETHPQIKEINAVLYGIYERMKASGFDPFESHSLFRRKGSIQG